MDSLSVIREKGGRKEGRERERELFFIFIKSWKRKEKLSKLGPAKGSVIEEMNQRVVRSKANF